MHAHIFCSDKHRADRDRLQHSNMSVFDAILVDKSDIVAPNAQQDLSMAVELGYLTHLHDCALTICCDKNPITQLYLHESASETVQEACCNHTTMIWLGEAHCQQSRVNPGIQHCTHLQDVRGWLAHLIRIGFLASKTQNAAECP